MDSVFERTKLSREANRGSQKLFPIFKMGCVQKSMKVYEKMRKQALHKQIGLLLNTCNISTLFINLVYVCMRYIYMYQTRSAEIISKHELLLNSLDFYELPYARRKTLVLLLRLISQWHSHLSCYTDKEPLIKRHAFTTWP